jgi:hypothetical protein
MPEPLWIYLMALLYFTKLSTCSTMADAFDSASHDRLTRMLHGDWSGQIRFDLALRLLFVAILFGSRFAGWWSSSMQLVKMSRSISSSL